MRGFWGYLVLVVLLAVVSFLALSSGITYTGRIVSERDGQEFDPSLVYTCPENECPDSSGMNETIEGCKDVLRKYEERTEELETEMEILRERVKMFLEKECETRGGERSMEYVENIVDPECVRDFAVFIVSNSAKDPVTALYEYVRMNVKFVSDPEDEYVASPCETILSGGGDCEDHAILLASLLEAVGVDSRVIWIPGEHTFVGITAEGEVEGICDDALRFGEGGESILVADTTFSNCIGMVNEEYVVSGEDGWVWKNKPVVFDV